MRTKRVIVDLYIRLRPWKWIEMHGDHLKNGWTNFKMARDIPWGCKMVGERKGHRGSGIWVYYKCC